ncbi:MAG: alkyl sulfatase dimerization domain-containing protein [Endozoicomonas sp.]|uniref:alkyl sulfatase dimerization domain-containing protein n=1 Tax=Endozoicomonas sp. TaxID=1892382 RepID=UPI003D9AEC4A
MSIPSRLKQISAVLSIGSWLFGLSLSVAASASTGSDVNLNTKDVRAGGTPVGDLIRVPIERVAITENVFYVSGLANVYLVNTPEGAVVIDTGFAHQAPKQMALLKEVLKGPVKYIFLPQGQHDDVGGIPLIKDEDTQIIMTRSSAEYMVHRKKASQFLLPRYAELYSWTKELMKKSQQQAKKKDPFPYKPITPDVLVEDHKGYKFELGGVKFEVLALPGAEGINSAGLWMPEEKILFAGGGSVGPEIPMWPNLGTVRSDRNRILEEYIDTLNTMIELEPEILLPGQDDPITDKKEIMSNLTLLRDAATYVHDEIWAGLSQGKDVYQLMRDIQLPEEYSSLSQQHGRVEWTIRETVNQAGAWFQYKYTSELYPYRPTIVYSDLVELSGGVDNVIKMAQKRLKEGDPIKAIHLIEVALEAEPNNKKVTEAHIQVLQVLLKQAGETHKTFSEIAWLQSQIGKAKAKL